LNITNRCTNKCNFCIRNKSSGIGDYNLWLDEEPSTQEIIDAVGNPSKYPEVVFCGYGEPLLRVHTVIEVAKHIKDFDVPVRINTNGQANLVHEENIVPELEGLVDTISISLNAENSVKYDEICQSEFGEDAFEGLLQFTRECKRYIPNVVLSVVDVPEIDIEKCKIIAQDLEVDLRIRTYTE